MIVAIIVLIMLTFGMVVFFGAPYLPTLRRQQEAAFDLLDLKPGQTLLELGSGDGRVLKAAAQRGLKVVGYELNPLLVIFSYLYTWRYRSKIQIIWGNYWYKTWPKADGIFVFLLEKYMPKLNTEIDQYPYKPISLASFAFKIPGKKEVKQKNGVYLYEYSQAHDS